MITFSQISRFWAIIFCCLFLGAWSPFKPDIAPSSSKPWNPPKKASKSYTLDAANNETQGLDVLEGEYALPELLNYALSHNPETKSAWYEAKVAAAKKMQAFSIFYPQIGIGGAAKRGYFESLYFQLPTLEYNSLSGKASADWTVFDLGGWERAMASSHALYAANLSHNRAIQTVLFQVYQAYFLFYSNLKIKESVLISIQEAETAFQLSEKRERAGLGTKTDLLQAKAKLEQKRFNLTTLTANIENSRAQLAQAIGVRVSKNFNIKPPVIPEDITFEEGDIEAYIEQALKNRPDILSQVAQLKSLKNEKIGAYGGYLPKLIAQGQGSVFYFPGDSLNALNADLWTVGISLQWNIFDGFNREGKLLKARAQEKKQQAALKKTELKIISNVWGSYYAYVSAVKGLESARSLLAASEESHRAIERGYRSGLNQILDLLNSQNDLALARRKHIQAKTNVALNAAQLSYEMGGLGKMEAQQLIERYE